MTRKLIIDTDPGVDDGMAIQLALNSKEFEILGLTTVFGNIDVNIATTNALRLLYLANKPTIPVAKGASKPLNREFSGGVPFVHGEDGQGNTWQPASPLLPINNPADEFIIEQILKFPNELTIAAIGPLTNIASALHRNPEIQDLVIEIVIMGGNAFCSGNATPAAEANILSDPEAADIVLGANWAITMVGLDVTHKIILHKDVLEEISLFDSSLNKQVTSAYIFYQDFFMKTNKIEGTYVHDSSVFAYLINKSLFKTLQFPIRVETTDCLSIGKTWPSLGESDYEEDEALKPWDNRPKINICVGVDNNAVVELLKSRLR
ncbi:MAG: nucleoside hydrolase [Bacteroidetes bacterium]|nr:nucleoside hydrolase [Bacteroidota bacterium]